MSTLLRLATLLLLAAVTATLPAQAAPRPVLVAQYGQPATITGVDLQNGTSTFPAGSTINVVMNGTPGCYATFDITNVVTGVAMREVARGRYQGAYVVPNNVVVSNGRLIGALQSRNGATVRMTANGGLDVGQPYATGSSYPQNSSNQNYPYQGGNYNPNQGGNYTRNGQMFVNITSPRQGERVGSDFTLTGNTVPNAQISIISRRSGGVGNSSTTSTGVADASGNFAIPVRQNGTNVLNVLLGGGNNNTSLTITATDPRTSQSRQVQMNVANGN